MTPLLAQHLRTDRSFERLYRRHVADVYHYALAVCRNETDAEDVTQTTFMNAYRAFKDGQQPRAPKNWLIAIAHNVCRQRFRHAASRPDEVELDDGAGAVVPDDDGPSAADLRRALGELAFNQRAALVMRELEGRTYLEIAEILGVSVSAVETLIFRARRALREQLDGSLTCHEAELALSRQLDGRLPRNEKGPLRAHLRACKDCASFARSQRAQRSAFKSLLAVPLPSSLASLFGGGGATVGTALATKAAAVTAVGLLVTGAGVETARQHPWRSQHTKRTSAAGPPARAARNVAVATQPVGSPVGAARTTRAQNRTSPGRSKRVSTAPELAPRAPSAAARARATRPAHPVHPVQSHKPKKHHASGHGRPATAGQGSQAPPHGRANGTTIRNPHANGHGKSGPKGSNRSSGRAESTRRNNVTLPSLPVQPPQVDLPQLA